MKNQSSSSLENYGFDSLTLKAFDPQYSYSRIQNTNQDSSVIKQRYTTNSSYELCVMRHVFVMATCPGHLCCQGTAQLRGGRSHYAREAPIPLNLFFPACSSSFIRFFLISRSSASNLAFQLKKFSIVTGVPWNSFFGNKRHKHQANEAVI